MNSISIPRELAINQLRKLWAQWNKPVLPAFFKIALGWLPSRLNSVDNTTVSFPSTFAVMNGIRQENKAEGRLIRSDGRSVVVRRSWRHLSQHQKVYLESLFTDPDCNELCPQYGFKAQNVFGVNYPPFISQKKVDELRENYDTLPTDIYVVTYPKCGTQWTLSVVSCLKTRKSIERGYENRFFPWPERIGLEQVNKLTKEARIFKSHAPISILPWRRLHPDTKIIYVMRNPKDAVVSFHEHTIQPERDNTTTPREFCDYTGDLSNFFELFAKNKLPFGSYFDHVAGWWRLAAENKKQVLWVHYEDMQSQFEREITRMARHCGFDHDEDMVRWVSKETSFAALKEASENAGHFRKGVVGDWRNFLSKAQAEYLDSRFEAELAHLGLQNKF
jgi:hypothetical protein